MSFARKVLRNKLKKKQGNNKIRDIFQYIQSLKREGDYKTIKQILKG